MKNLSLLSLACGTLLLFGAGCGSSTSTPSSTTPPAAMNNSYGAPTASVPEDILTYPGGTVIASTGYGNSHTVAQLTRISTDTLLNWVRAEYPKKGLTLKNTSIEGGSTTFTFENTERRYTVRVDRPLDNQGSSLTVIREGK